MKFVISVLLFHGFLSVVLGCSCFPSHHQYKFCRSKFVIHAVPVAEDIPNPPDQTKDRVYKLVIIEVFKDNSGALEPFTIKQAFTAFHGATCGVHLTKYKSYVLGGSYDGNGNMRINLCGLNRLFKSYEPCELAWMRGFTTFKYGARHEKKPGYDCSCKVNYCSDQQTGCSSNSNECLWNGKDNNNNNCKREYGQCQWKQCPKGKFEQLYFNSGY